MFWANIEKKFESFMCHHAFFLEHSCKQKITLFFKTIRITSKSLSKLDSSHTQPRLNANQFTEQTLTETCVATQLHGKWGLNRQKRGERLLGTFKVVHI